MNRVEWIKKYRELNGCSLKEALDAFDNGKPLEKKQSFWLVGEPVKIVPSEENNHFRCSDQDGLFILVKGSEVEQFDLNRLIVMSEKGPDELDHTTRCVIQAMLAVYNLGAKGITKVSEGVQITED